MTFERAQACDHVDLSAERCDVIGRCENAAGEYLLILISGSKYVLL